MKHWRVLVFSGLLVVIGAGILWAQTETITLTTYYPSPRGVYDELRTAGDVVVGNLTPIWTGLSGDPARLEVVSTAPVTSYDTHLVLTNTNVLSDATGILFNAATRDWAMSATNPNSGFGDELFVVYDNNVVFPGGGRLFIDQQGDVGIGLTNLVPPGPINPGAQLHVVQEDAADAFRVDDQAVPDATPFVIDQNGDVGIGTPTPARRLHVSGTVRLQGLPGPGAAVGQLCIEADGDIYVGAVGTCL